MLDLIKTLNRFWYLSRTIMLSYRLFHMYYFSDNVAAAGQVYFVILP